MRTTLTMLALAGLLVTSTAANAEVLRAEVGVAGMF